MIPEGALNSEFYQICYVTNDLDRALRQFEAAYAIPNFIVKTSEARRVTPDGDETAAFRVALAQLASVQIEVIEMKPSEQRVTLRMFKEVLPSEEFGLALHHLGHRIKGDIGAWRQFRDNVGGPDHPIALEGDLEHMKWVYLDERKRLGHYLEFIWRDPSDTRNFPSHLKT